MFWAPTIALFVATPVFAATCDSLKSVQLPNATITSAQVVEAGKFTLPSPAQGQAPRFDDLPAFCRVTATIQPSSDSDIKAEFWLPVSGWNGRLQATGAGVWFGNINYGAMANILRTGAATAASDNGHEGGSASFALGHPEKVKDFAYRAHHEATVDAKTLIKAFYDKPASLSMMNECGGAGRSAITAIQRYPEDFDIIMAGGLDNNSTHHTFGQMWVWQATHSREENYIPPEKYAVINKAALAACDAKDGATDGLIQDPTKCKFDPAVVACKNGDGPDCLTRAQLESARVIYRPITNPRTGQYIFGPLLPGSELGWGVMAGAAPFPYSVEFFRYLVFKDPKWDYKTRPVNFDSDVALADTPENLILNARNPDLSKYFSRRGKLLLLGGWNDTAIAPSSNYDYYNEVIVKMGNKARNSMRLFMVPGMGHCPVPTGGTGFSIDTQSVLEQWQSSGKPPDQVIAEQRTNGKLERKTLVCAYPQIAVYKGNGSLDDPANFFCRRSK